MSVNLFPQNACDVSDAEAGDSCENPGCDDDTEEIPQPAHERSARELIRKKVPCERRCADEAGEKPDVRGEILDGRPSKLVILGENVCLSDYSIS